MSDNSYETIWRYFKRKAVKKKKMSSKVGDDELVDKRPKEKKEVVALVETSANNLIPDVIRSEVNFLIFPFFALWDKDVKKRTETEVKMKVKRGSEKLEILWNVSANPKFGYPASFDKRVHKAIEQIIAELPRPILNPIPLGSLYNIFKRMGIKKVGGSQYKKIRDALSRIRATTVVSKAAFFSKGEEMFIDDEFGLYDRVVSKGKKLENGEIADTNYLYLNSWYLENINAHYVKPIDWSYYNFLENPIAQRLYELLGVKFYGVIKKGHKFLSYKYSNLCDLLPATRQKYFSQAKQVLDPAHEKLKSSGFLAEYRWGDTSPKIKGDWLITYYAGKRVREEISKFKEYYAPQKDEFQALPEPEIITTPEEAIEVDPKPKKSSKTEVEPEKPQETKPEPQAPEQSESEPISEESDLIDQLVAHTVSRSVAEELVRNFDLEFIREWLEVIDYVKKADDKAAFLVSAIRQGWAVSEKYKTLKQRAEREKATEQETQRQREEAEEKMAKAKAEAERLDGIFDSLSDEQQEEIKSEAEERLPDLVKTFVAQGKTDSPMIDANRLIQKREVVKEWLEKGKIETG